MAEKVALHSTYSLGDLLAMGEPVVEVMKKQFDNGELIDPREYKPQALSELIYWDEVRKQYQV